MKLILKIISFCGLALTLMPAFFVVTGFIEFETHKLLMLIGTVLWFATCPFWIGKTD